MGELGAALLMLALVALIVSGQRPDPELERVRTAGRVERRKAGRKYRDGGRDG